MAGAADGGQRLCWDLSRRAASFLRMARLALTGASPAQLLAGEEVVVDGHICDPCYKSIRTEDDGWESDEPWPEKDESEQLIVGDDEDGSTTRSGVSGRPLNRKSQVIGLRPATTAGAGAALRSEKNVATVAAAAESAEPLMPRRSGKRANDAEMVHHPFGCDRQVGESSSLLLVSS